MAQRARAYRAEAATPAARATLNAIAVCHLLGASTRRMATRRQLGITSSSKSQVSLTAKELHTQVGAFRNTPLVQLVTSDVHAGLVTAIGTLLPDASQQRGRTHYSTNLMAVTPKAS
ncbi:hypothetical protein HFP48_30215 (plasmid) [Rhodococcus sp. DMU1]|nr:hypothetical protein HFP48_30215 [Rhodococcus sp. DMU1]